MSYLQDFLYNFDFDSLIQLIIRVVAALLCITLHEMAHGYVAFRLGDPTAKAAKRLSFNPVRHIDPFGLLMMIVAGVGWAKPVPINPLYFKNPKKGMAITALAGPCSNFVLAYIALLLGGFLYRVLINSISGVFFEAVVYIVIFFARCAMLSVGLGLFNLIPIPPLDGAKVAFSVLPEHAYFKIMQYEKYIMLVMFAVVFLGVIDIPLSYCIKSVLRFLCKIAFFPSYIFGF